MVGWRGGCQTFCYTIGLQTSVNRPTTCPASSRRCLPSEDHDGRGSAFAVETHPPGTLALIRVPRSGPPFPEAEIQAVVCLCGTRSIATVERHAAVVGLDKLAASPSKRAHHDHRPYRLIWSLRKRSPEASIREAVGAARLTFSSGAADCRPMKLVCSS